MFAPIAEISIDAFVACKKVKVVGKRKDVYNVCFVDHVKFGGFGFKEYITEESAYLKRRMKQMKL